MPKCNEQDVKIIGRTTLYRIEYLGGEGLYHEMNSVVAPYVVFGGDEPDMHPGPAGNEHLMKEIAIRGKTLTDYFFAFANVSDLLAWVPYRDWMVELHDFGLMLAVYECDQLDVIHTYRQSVFCGFYGKLQYSLIDYFNLPEKIS
jgi:hypothetical protein